MSSLLVNVDPEILNRLASFAGELMTKTGGSNFVSDCNELIAKGNVSGLFSELLSQTAGVFAADAADVDGFFVGIVYCIDSFCNGDVNEVVKAIAAVNGASAADPALRLSVLVSMFNTSNSTKCRFELIKAVLSFAQDSNQCGQVFKFHQYVDAWVACWKLSTDEQRVLFRLMAEVLAVVSAGAGADGGVPSSSAVAAATTTMTFSQKYLTTFSNAGEKLSAAQSEEYTKLATAAAVHAIRSGPAAHRLRGDIHRSLTASAHVKATAELASLTEMLSVICAGSLPQFMALSTKNSALMTQHKLSVEKVSHTVKLLTVCAAVEGENSANSATISYDAIINSVKTKSDGSLDVSEVEYWIVETIANELINATINQCDRTVTIRSCAVIQPQGIDSIRVQLSNINNSVSASTSTIGAPSN